MDRVCTHERKHPDPDALTFKVATQTPQWLVLTLKDHDCDGCCHWPTEDQDDAE